MPNAQAVLQRRTDRCRLSKHTTQISIYDCAFFYPRPEFLPHLTFPASSLPVFPPPPPPQNRGSQTCSLARSPPFPLLPSTNFIPSWPPSLPLSFPDPTNQPTNQLAAPSTPERRLLPSQSRAARQQPRQPHPGQLLIKTSSSSRKNERRNERRSSSKLVERGNSQRAQIAR